MMNTEMEDEGERQNRVLLRPWLENMLDGGFIPGLEWFDAEKTMFKVPWKHRSKKDWSMRHSSVFLEWAKNTGRWSDGDVAPNFAQLKTRLRCAFNKAPDIKEMKEFNSNKGEEPFKVYRFTLCNDMSGRRTQHRNNISSSSCNQSQQLMSLHSLTSLQVTGDDYEFEDGVNMDMNYRRLCSNFLPKLNMPVTASQITEHGPQSSRIFSSTSKDTSWKSDPNVKESSELGEDVKGMPSMIPVCVELLASDSSDLFNSDSGSPLISDCPPDSAMVVNGEAEKERGSMVNSQWQEKVGSGGGGIFCQTSSRCSVDLELPKEHMLRVASLFVEADKKRMQQGASSTQNFHDVTDGAIHTTGSTVQSVLSKCIVVTPYEDQMGCNLEKHGNAVDLSESVDYFFEQSQSKMDDEVIDLTCRPHDEKLDNEPIDLTKGSSLLQNKGTTEDRTNSSKQERMKKIFDSVVNEALSEIEDNGLDFKLTKLSPIEQLQRKMQQSEELFLVKDKFLTNWELRLKTWEGQLKAREETYYWRSRCFETELASRGLSFKTLSQQMLHVPKHEVGILEDDPTPYRLPTVWSRLGCMPREVVNRGPQEPLFVTQQKKSFESNNFVMPEGSLENTLKPTSKTAASKIRLKLASKKQRLASSAYNAPFILPKVDPGPVLVHHHRLPQRTDNDDVVKNACPSSEPPHHILPDVLTNVICASNSSPVAFVESSHHQMSSSVTYDEGESRILPNTISSATDAVNDGVKSGCLADALPWSSSFTKTTMPSSVLPVNITIIDSDVPISDAIMQTTSVRKIETTQIFDGNSRENCHSDVVFNCHENRIEDAALAEDADASSSDSENELVIQTSDEEMADDQPDNNQTPIDASHLQPETLPSETIDHGMFDLSASTDYRSHPLTTETSIYLECGAHSNGVVSNTENVLDDLKMPGKGRIVSVEEFQTWLRNRTTSICCEGTLTVNEFPAMSISCTRETTTDHGTKENDKKRRKHEDEGDDGNQLKREATFVS